VALSLGYIPPEVNIDIGIVFVSCEIVGGSLGVVNGRLDSDL
jgi:hypothetical protein